jgi:hypothetical protein
VALVVLVGLACKNAILTSSSPKTEGAENWLMP